MKAPSADEADEPTRGRGFFALADQGLVSGASFLTTILVGRLAGLDQLGIYSLGCTLVILIACAQEALIAVPYTVNLHDVPKHRRAGFAGSLLVQSALLAVVMMFALAGFAAMFSAGVGKAALAPMVWVLAATIVPVLLRELGRRHAFAHLNFRRAFKLDLVTTTLQLGGMAILFAMGALNAVSTCLVIGIACGAATLGWLARSAGQIRIEPDRLRKDFRRSWSLGRWSFPGRVTAALQLYVVHWLLMFKFDAVATGVFAACLTVVQFSNPFLFAFSNLVFPHAAQTFAQTNGRGVRRVVLGSLKWLLPSVALFCAAVAMFGDHALTLLYGQAYAGSGAILVVMGLAVVNTAFNMAIVVGLYAMRKADVQFKASLLALVVTVVAAVYLMPSMEVLGGAVAWLIGGLVSSAFQFYVFMRWTAETSEANAVASRADADEAGMPIGRIWPRTVDDATHGATNGATNGAGLLDWTPPTAEVTR